MPIVRRTINDIARVYFSFTDDQGRRREQYCGRADDEQAIAKAERLESDYVTKRIKKGIRKATGSNSAFRARMVAESIGQHLAARLEPGSRLARNRRMVDFTADFAIESSTGSTYVDLKIIAQFSTLRNAIGQLVMIEKRLSNPTIFVFVFVGDWMIEDVLGRLDDAFGLRNVQLERGGQFGHMIFNNPAIRVLISVAKGFDELMQKRISEISRRIMEEVVGLRP